MQSPQIILIVFVARQLLPHLGQTYLRVLLGFFLLFPPLGSVPRTSNRETPSTICKSCQPCDSMKSNRSIPGLVIVQPYLGWCSTSSPCASAIALNRLLWYTPLLLVSLIGSGLPFSSRIFEPYPTAQARWHISCKSVAQVSSIGRLRVAELMLISYRRSSPACQTLPQVKCPYAPTVFLRLITTSGNAPSKSDCWEVGTSFQAVQLRDWF